MQNPTAGLTTDLRSDLQALLDLGLGVIPVRDKRPRVRGWTRTGGIRAAHEVERLISNNDVGIPTGYPLTTPFVAGVPLEQRFLCVLDVDKRHGGLQALEKLELPETVTAKTRNDGLHLWFWTPEPARSFVRDDGLEVKGVGSYVVVPPSEGYAWIRNPWEWEIARCPEALLEPPAERAVPATDPVATGLVFDIDEIPQYEALGPYVAAVSAAKEGSRRKTLLSVSGSVKRHLIATGLVREDVARDALKQAGVKAGLTEAQALRRINWSFGAPLRAGAYQEKGEKEGLRTTLSQAERDVLQAVVRHFEARAEKFECLFADLGADLLSARYLAAQSGWSKSQVSRELPKLLARGLLWPGSPKLPTESSLYHGKRYRPTYAALRITKSSLWTPFEPEQTS